VPSAHKEINSISQPVSDLEEQIRARAYELYEQREEGSGSEVEDWLQAESEIRGLSNKLAA